MSAREASIGRAPNVSPMKATGRKLTGVSMVSNCDPGLAWNLIGPAHPRLPPAAYFCVSVHSEMSANLLIRRRSNFRDFSERALINNADHLDFDSAIPRFESWRPSQSTLSDKAFRRSIIFVIPKFVPHFIPKLFPGRSTGSRSGGYVVYGPLRVLVPSFAWQLFCADRARPWQSVSSATPSSVSADSGDDP